VLGASSIPKEIKIRIEERVPRKKKNAEEWKETLGGTCSSGCWMNSNAITINTVAKRGKNIGKRTTAAAGERRGGQFIGWGTGVWCRDFRGVARGGGRERRRTPVRGRKRFFTEKNRPLKKPLGKV